MLERICSILPETLYYISVTIISVYYYVRTLDIKYKKSSSKVWMCIAIWLTHMILLFPMEEQLKNICIVLQIIGEFLIVYVAMEDSFKKKLWVYVKLNVYFGISMLLGNGFIHIINSTKGMMSNNAAWMLELLYYVFIVTVAQGIFGIALRIEGRSNRGVNANYRGITLTTLCSVGILGYMYGIAYVCVNMDMQRIYVYTLASIMVVIGMMVILIIINVRMNKQEHNEMKLHVLEMYKNSMLGVAKILQEELLYYEDVVVKTKSELDYMYGNAMIGDNITEVNEKEETSISSGKILRNLMQLKKDKAKSMDINIVDKLEVIHMPEISSRDVVTIVANLIDNAIEASTANTEDKRNIYVDIESTKDNFYICVENSFTGKLKRSGENFYTSKKDGVNHGMGISNVRNTAEKYGLKLEIEVDEDSFIAKVGK